MSVLPDKIIASLVVKNKLAPEDKLDECKRFAAESNSPLEEVIIEQGVVDDDKFGQILADYYKVPFVSLDRMDIPDEIFNLVSDRVIRKQKVVVFARDTTAVKIAMLNPENKEVPEMLAKKTGQKIIVHLATMRNIQSALRIYQSDLQKIIDNILAEDIGRSTEAILKDPPMARIVDMIIETAYQNRASDIHIEPQETSCLVRYRIDGALHKAAIISKQLHDRIITRIKVLSNLRTDEHLAAQDGKLRIQLSEEIIDIRVSILPIADGEKIVMRLLSSRSRQFTLKDLGMSDEDFAKINRAFTRSYGAILCTGPTGSGKTTTIYAILKIINTIEKNITTIEDPVEYRISGANQIQVNTKTNLTFAAGLRSILRQDPNVIFVGEIRDDETAEIAINAALTGHLVLSTLHTNDAATAVPRLVDMNVEPFLVASTVSIVMAQRLVRKICLHCRTESTVDIEELTKHFPIELIKKNWGKKEKYKRFRGTGCRICKLSGYQGRVGLFEVLEVNESVRKLINQKADADAIASEAIKDGMKTILMDGFAKVEAGLTTIEEVIRVTKAEFA